MHGFRFRLRRQGFRPSADETKLPNSREKKPPVPRVTFPVRYFSVKLLTFNIRNDLLLAISVILFQFFKNSFQDFLHHFMTNFAVKPGKRFKCPSPQDRLWFCCFVYPSVKMSKALLMDSEETENQRLQCMRSCTAGRSAILIFIHVFDFFLFLLESLNNKRCKALRICP